MKASQETARQVNHILIQGEPLTGKSTLASKMAELGWNLIWFSMDGNHSILSKLSKAAQDRVTLIRLPDTREFPIAADVIRKVSKYPLEDCNICDNHGMVNCSVCQKVNLPFELINLGRLPQNTIVVWDNLSQLSDSFINLITKNKPVDYKLQLDDWGSLRFHMMDILNRIKVAPYNLICISHSIEALDEAGNKKLMPMVGSAEFSRKVAGYFDDVIFLSLSNNKHRQGSSTTYTHQAVVGSRRDIKIEDMKEPSLAPFFNWIEPTIVENKEKEKEDVGSGKSDNIIPIPSRTINSDSSLESSRLSSDTIVAHRGEEAVKVEEKEDPIAKAKAMLAKMRGGKR
jgi:hypothetical protein